MLLTPRYDGPPVLSLDGPPGAIAVPAIRQQRRLVETLAGLSDEQWNHPSRCDGWTARDVATHLHSVHGFWALSAAQGMKGEPTRFLARFDPVTSPPQMVAAAARITPAELVDQMRASTAMLEAQWSSLSDDDWTALAEAPPGHITVSALVHHALWDSWTHERDILVPLGITPTVEDDEVAASLRYVAALTPAFALCAGASGQGSFAIDADHVQAVVTVDDEVRLHTGAPVAGSVTTVLRGDPVALLEMLTFRAPWTIDVPADEAWMLGGLATTFDRPA